MKRSIFLAVLPVMLAGCASRVSVVEQTSGPKLPPFYTAHSGGFVNRPTEAEIAQAVQFGSSATENPSSVKDAYLSKAEIGAAATEPFYIIVRTPLYLIARHALERARAGGGPDPKYLAFARRLGLVKLAVSERKISLATWEDLATGRNLSLLRNGVRVEPARAMPAWHGIDPFFDPADPLASWQSDSWLKHGVEDMKLQSQLQSEERAVPTTGERKDGGQQVAAISLDPSAAIFSIEELRKPGHYEIVLRQLHPGAPGAGANPEIRFPIDFSGFP